MKNQEIPPEVAEPVDIQHCVFLFRIHHRFKEGMNEKEIYEMTRGFWYKISKEGIEKAQYAFGVVDGIVRGVFSVDEWGRAKDARIEEFPNRKSDPHRTDQTRWFFTSNRKTPDEIRVKYLGKSVRHEFTKGMQRPNKFVCGPRK